MEDLEVRPADPHEAAALAAVDGEPVGAVRLEESAPETGGWSASRTPPGT